MFTESKIASDIIKNCHREWAVTGLIKYKEIFYR